MAKRVKEEWDRIEWMKNIKELQANWTRDSEMQGQRIGNLSFPNVLLHTGSTSDSVLDSTPLLKGGS